MRTILLRWGINAVAVYAAISWVQGLHADNGVVTYLAIALILGMVNAVIAPLLKLLTCPLILLTLGLFTLVINGIMLQLAASISGWLGLGFYVEGFGPAFWGALIISVVSFALSLLTGVNQREERRG